MELDKWWLDRVKKKYKIKSKSEFEDFIRKDRAKSKANPIYFINEHILVKNKFPEGKVPEHLEQVGDKIRFILYPKQEELVKLFLKSSRIVIPKSRQTGVSTTFQAISLWFAQFFSNKEIIIISKDEEAAKEFLANIKFMYINQPPWIRRKILFDNKKALALGKQTNFSIIRSMTSGRSSGRSVSASLLILDEAEFIQGVEEIWASAAPTLSATNGKAVIISTPYKAGSWFHRLCLGAEEGSNNFDLFKFKWTEIPGRDEEWYREQCETLDNDPKKIKTELDLGWIRPGTPFFSEELLSKLKTLEPIKKRDDWMIYQKPRPEGKYVIGVDIYEGGGDYNAMFILDVDKLLEGEGDGIVADFRSKKINIKDDIIEAAKQYNEATVVIEKNKGFSLIRDLIEEGYSHLLARPFDFRTKKFKDDYGLYISHNRNYLLTLATRWLSKSTSISPRLKYEMETFILKGVRYEGAEHDDILFAFIYALYHIEILRTLKSSKKKAPQRGWLRKTKTSRGLEAPEDIGAIPSKDYIDKWIEQFSNTTVRNKLPI